MKKCAAILIALLAMTGALAAEERASRDHSIRTLRGHDGWVKSVAFSRSGDVLAGTAVCRSHYYHDKAYGNFIGLSRLMELVAKECGMSVGELAVVSTDARLESITRMRDLMP